MKRSLKQGLEQGADRLLKLARGLAMVSLVVAALTALLLLLSCVAVPAHAQVHEERSVAGPTRATTPAPQTTDLSASLPSDASVVEALQGAPAWRAALARHQAERARGAALALNPNDWTPSASWAQRNARADGATAVPGVGDVRTREWSVGLSRGLRLPAKSQAAAAAGEGQQARADAQLAWAWHELMRTWLDDALAVLQAARQEQLLAAQFGLWEQQHQAAERRHALGDAARQELVLLDAGRAQAQAQWWQARQRWQTAQSVWRNRYPGLALPRADGTVADADKVLPLETAAADADVPAVHDARDVAWLDAHPQWRLARLEADAAEAQARLAEAERHPDPTVGVQVGRERSGAERILGVNVSWPLGSAARSLQSQAQWAEAQAAQARERDVRRELQSNFAQWRAEWQAGQQVWQAAERAQAQARQAALAVRKGYGLGEGTLSEVLLLQRQWLDAQQAAATAELEALRARWRWSLETGARWAWVPEAAR